MSADNIDSTTPVAGYCVVVWKVIKRQTPGTRAYITAPGAGGGTVAVCDEEE